MPALCATERVTKGRVSARRRRSGVAKRLHTQEATSPRDSISSDQIADSESGEGQGTLRAAALVADALKARAEHSPLRSTERQCDQKRVRQLRHFVRP